MAEKTKAANNAAASDVDIGIITEIFKIDSKKTLVWNGFLPDGKKKQYWIDGAVEWELHLKGIKKQGGNLAYKNAAGEMVCKMGVIDIDAQGKDKISLTPVQAAAAAFKSNTKLVPFKSPRGNWHMYYFFNKEIKVKEANRIIKSIAAEFKNFNIDVDKILPTATGSQCGINLPYCSDSQIPYDPRGNKYTKNQFINRLRFNNFPIAASIVGMKEGIGSRYQSLCMAATELNIAGKYTDERIEQINQTFDPPLEKNDNYLNRIKEDKIFDKYKFLTDETKAEWINQFTKIEDFKLPDDAEDLSALDLEEYTGKEQILQRPWVIFGWVLKQALTLIVGQPGIGKTMLMHMLAWCLCTGIKILGKEILERANVLILCPEETKNEIRMRLKAMSQFLGKDDGKFKIYIRGIEDAIKLVKFGLTDAAPTKDYKRLKKSLINLNIKYIILDPLISFQTGNYDENSNQKMEQYIKNYLIPIAVDLDGAIIAGHHTNKLSMVSVVDKELLVDHQSAMFSARGASALIAAARFVLGMQPMTRKLWEQYFKDHITDGTTFIHYAGLIEAKSNYNVVEDDICWLRKNSVDVDTDKGKEKTGVFSITDLNKITKAKNKLKAAKNEEYARSFIPVIKKLMEEKGENLISLHSAVMAILPEDPRAADDSINEKTIITSIRRKLENGLHGKQEDSKKGGLTSTGIEYDDGFNYWIKRDNSKEGAAKVFIERGKDFKK